MVVFINSVNNLLSTMSNLWYYPKVVPKKSELQLKNSGLNTSNPYSNNEDIREVLTCADDETVKVKVDRFETESKFDSLRITTSDKEYSEFTVIILIVYLNLVVGFSGTELSSCFTLSTWVNVNSTFVILGFKSDHSVTKKGVDVIARCVSRNRRLEIGWTGYTIRGQVKCVKMIGLDQLQNAQSRCADLGASVPLPLNEDENADYMVAFRELGSDSYVALGANDVASEGDWQDNDGNAVAYTNWKSGQPNNYGIQDYVSMRISDGTWWDDGATEERSIICET